MNLAPQSRFLMTKAPSMPDERLQEKAPEIGDILGDRYRLIRNNASVGMGVVFERLQLALEPKVAIKLMHSHLVSMGDFGRRFEREVLIAKELMHPNMVRIYDFGTSDSGMMYLVMEFLEGRELTEELAEGPMAIKRVGKLALQMLDGLGEAHAIDVIHRD